MIQFKFGDVVLLNFPFSDGTNFKKRPALIINDFNDGDILVCRITSQKHFDKYDIIVENWAKFGLLIPSSIRVHKLATLDKKLFYKKLGSIDFEIEKQVKSLVSQLTDN
ncbi:MAG: type II toxin-antitoxin system PemK/MazF family toxin [Saprospiraceae bacterium]|jgi:mRNA interferase MazF|uniref:type II toxin-antitoxin system PemK/MazF family toxin n=1 Tax=Candidatus Brachybacter algidus TaxID=2982024 RepID=UPI001B543FB2|nr:type II toxin-antitoxin system PemK/MazF family toxin [Candidatus Brachybacter algidus]MBP7538832.1 type II toxin-antitoxin system PemK/MazF family toxin [Saprospiraceae bacterium]MBK6372910.1 type II toxin-antitoxin system PemK/MazF family toxin [Candidatus Brachybacter algidus]MBK6448121.1 type II toxin-antitoxin system PemK/MazF family toxin [Candidatus Brachybacter algidus]MBK7602934.1 type II toxin-antitoxin system PemK/MazF family toxin [Candidatus Brachybacter algidus]MBK8602026.1 ty